MGRSPSASREADVKRRLAYFQPLVRHAFARVAVRHVLGRTNMLRAARPEATSMKCKGGPFVLGLVISGTVTLVSAVAEMPNASCPVPENTLSTTNRLFDDFTDGKVNSSLWEKVQANWGGLTEDGDYSGGVLKENIGDDDGKLALFARGNAYEGPIRGRNSDGTIRPDGRRTGAAIMSRERYLGGRFEARVTIPAKLGVVSAMWTFFYEKTDDGVEHNHEIDIEFPGQENAGGKPRLDYVSLTTWRGLRQGQSKTVFWALPEAVADGKFHILRFDWVPPDAQSPGVVTFYIDGNQLAVIKTNVPSKPGNLWLGLWFPPKWAGEPEFSEAVMKVDWVRIAPPN